MNEFLVISIASVLIIKSLYRRRAQARLQEEVRNLLFEYVPLDGCELETITFVGNEIIGKL